MPPNHLHGSRSRAGMLKVSRQDSGGVSFLSATLNMSLGSFMVAGLSAWSQRTRDNVTLLMADSCAGVNTPWFV